MKHLLRHALPVMVGFVIAASGCTHKAKHAAACRLKAQKLGAFLLAMDHDVSPFPLGRDIELPTRDTRKTALPMAPVVMANADKIVFEGASVSEGRLRAKLTAAAAHARAAHEAKPSLDAQLLYLAADIHTPWSRIVAISGAAYEAGFRHLAVTFARKPSTPPPPPSDIDRQLDAIIKGAAGERATKAARLARQVVDDCPPLRTVFATVTASEDDDKATALLTAVEPAVIKCHCNVNIPDLRSLLWRVVGNPHPMTFVRVDLDPSAAEVVELPAGTPWQRAQARFVSTTSSMWMKVAGRAQ